MSLVRVFCLIKSQEVLVQVSTLLFTDLPPQRFTRGWTLQELIAPKKVLFFDARWNKRGFKTTIAAELSAITMIDSKVLRNECSVSEFCVAQKLSWASRRKTTRVEDSAYCLLGLLDLNMPLLYGEGDKAFRRLQHEIIRSTEDLSIFAWRMNRISELKYSPAYAEGVLCGVLARSAAMFEGCNKYKSNQYGGYRESSVTNIGVKIRARVLARSLFTKEGRAYILPLNCTLNGRSLGLRLRQVGYDEYLRANPFALFQYDEDTLQSTRPAERNPLTALPKESFPLSTLMEHESKLLPSRRTHLLRILANNTTILINPWPADRYDFEDQLFFVFRDPARDFGMVDITFLIQSPKILASESKWGRCKFCALGWSSTNPDVAQFGIIEEDKFTSEISTIRSQFTDWDRDSGLLAYFLNRYNIPKTLSVRYLLPNNNHVAHITFTAKLEKDPSMSLNPFWIVDFSCTVWASWEKEPAIAKQTWQTPGA
jgi:hypothetical protein